MPQPEILGVIPLTGVIEERGMTDFPLSKLFTTPALTKKVQGDTTSWDLIVRTRKAGRFNVTGNKANLRAKSHVKKQYATLLEKYDKVTLNEHELGLHYREPGTASVIDVNGEAAIRRSGVDLAREFDRMREKVLGQMFNVGSQSFTFTPEGAATAQSFSVDFGHAITHFTPGIGGSGTFGTITANDDVAMGAWATVATNIIAQLEAADHLIIKDTDMAGPRLILAHRAIRQMLMRNTDVINLYGGSEGAAQAIVRNDLGTDLFMGHRWLWMGHQFVDEDGTTTDYWGRGRCAMIPLPSQEWFQWHSGSFLVPNLTKVNGAPIRRNGFSSWGKWEHDPVSIDLFAKEVYFPAILRPNAIVQWSATESATSLS